MVIEFKNISKNYGDLVIFDSLDAQVNEGDVICIVGGSGVGKSTLMRFMNLLDRPTSGSVIFHGQDLVQASEKQLDAVRQKIGMVFQSFNLFEHMTVLENLLVGPMKLRKVALEVARENALELLEMVGLKSKANSYPDELSGGQKQRVAIARTLSMNPEIILFDEPTSALDPSMVGEVTATIQSLSRQGKTMVIVTHDMDFVKDIATQIWFLAEGGIYEMGNVTEIFENPQKPLTQEFVYKIKTFTYEIESDDFDFIELLNKLDLFCQRQMMDLQHRETCRLLVEEIVGLLPKIEGTRIVFSTPVVNAQYELKAYYKGLEHDILSDDSIPTKLIKSKIKQNCHNFSNHTNEVVLKW